ncbi:hypothetical protein ACHAWF_015794 [Thalassiosira exigua]
MTAMAWKKNHLLMHPAGLCILFLPVSGYGFASPRSLTARGARQNQYNHVMERRQVVGSRLPKALYSHTAAVDCGDADGDEEFLKRGTTSPSASATPFVGLPSYRRIMFFLATTFLIWVSEPLLSLVDSAAVGRYAGKSAQSTDNLSSVVQLAALGPATMLCDSSIYLTMFISMATTNKLARAFARHDLKAQIRTLSHVMGVSLVVGTILLFFINFQGERVLASILGPAGATVSLETTKGVVKTMDLTPEVLRASMGYSRIRSAVSPLAVMGLSSQAACLCAQDTKTPLLAVAVASMVNIIGDYIFVARLRWGVRGAALATSLASLTANGMLVRKAWEMMCGWKSVYRENEHAEKPFSSKEVTLLETTDTRFISFPDQKSLISLLRLAGPMFFVMVGKIMGYSAMTVRAGSFGMVSLACHNVLMRIFFFFATVGDALSQSAQTFLPGLFYRKSLQEKNARDERVSSTDLSKNTDDDPNARKLLQRLMLISSIAGFLSLIMGQISSHSGRTFTSDSSLVSLMSHVSPFMGLALLLHPLTMALEGAIIAASDATYLVGTYVVSLVVLLAQLKFVCKDFLGVWHSLLLFQMIRITQFGARVWKRTASSNADTVHQNNN